MLDSRGFIPLMTPTQALKLIQVMEDHLHNWYDETTTRKKINDYPNNVDAIQASFKGAHLTKECPLEKVDMTARTKIGKESLKEPVPRDLPPTSFLGHLKEQIGDMDVNWDITVEDVERLRPIHDKEEIVRDEKQDYDIPLHDGVMQHLTPQTVHITPPDDDYVAPETSPTLDKQLNELGKECFNITSVAEMADGNPVKDKKELSDIIKTSDFETFVQKLLHQVSQSSYETG
ncbi:hypothetical protein Tco_1447179 [Tanacetum coccineum]